MPAEQQPSPADMLAADVERLEIAYRRAHEALAAELRLQGAWQSPQTLPDDLRDESGRFLLLDALAALVAGRAALVAGTAALTTAPAPAAPGRLLEALETLEGLPGGGHSVMRWARRKLGYAAPIQDVVIAAYQQALRTRTLEPPTYRRARLAALADALGERTPHSDPAEQAGQEPSPDAPHHRPIPPRDQP
ncbi:hypothetical protein AB0G05_26745 [Nonomuraea wenchangensis]